MRQEIAEMEKNSDFTGIHDKKFVCNKTQFENAAKALIECDVQFKVVSRAKSYFVKHEITGRKKETNRKEELIGYWLSKKKHMFENESVAIDFQVPLKNKRTDKGIGKIDVLAYNSAENKIYFMELKRPDNKETILRCALEAYAYSKIVDADKFLQDYQDAGLLKTDLTKDPTIVPCVLIFEGSEQELQLKDERNANTRKLMIKLGIEKLILNKALLAEEIPEVALHLQS